MKKRYGRQRATKKKVRRAGVRLRETKQARDCKTKVTVDAQITHLPNEKRRKEKGSRRRGSRVVWFFYFFVFDSRVSKKEENRFELSVHA